MKFSLIVPVYNISHYVEKCLSSIKSQDFDDFEVIVVDDGSTDESKSIVDNFRSNKFKIYHKKNEGLGPARNFAIKHASGEYLIFIDGDDWIERNALKNIANIIEQKPGDIYVFSWFVNDNELIRYNEKFNLPSSIKKAVLIDEVGSQAWKYIYKKSLFNGVEYADCFYEDLPTTYKLFYKTENIIFTDYAYYHYMVRTTSISYTRNVKKSFDIYSGFVEKYKFALENNLNNECQVLVFKCIVNGIFVMHDQALQGNKKTIKEICLFFKSNHKLCQISLSNKIKIEYFFAKYFTNIYVIFCRLYLRKKYK